MGKREIKVAVHEFRPIVSKKASTWSGFEIELLELVLLKIKRMHDFDISVDYIEVKEFEKLLSGLKEGAYDMASAGLTRTKERFSSFNMSFVTVPSGLTILSRARSSVSVKSLIKEVFFDKFFLSILLSMLMMSVVYANIYWFIEAGKSVSSSYLNGVFEAFWWVIVTFSTVGYGDISPETVLGKGFGIFVILSGLAVFGVYIAHVSSIFSESISKSSINNIDDLYTVSVATKRGTFAHEYLDKLGIKNIKFFNDISKAEDALVSGEVDAIVFDQPVLQEIYNKNSKKLRISNKTFALQSYAYFFPKGKDADLYNMINEAIVALRESGDYEELYSKYFDII